MTNVYQSFFDKLDATVAALDSAELADIDGPDHFAVLPSVRDDAVDLLRRAGYVLANLLNAQASIYPAIMLDPEPETVPGEAQEANDTPAPSVDEGQDAPE